MRKRVLIIFLSILSILLIVGFVKYSTFFKIDKCLDSGGSWNYETGKCEYAKNENINQNEIELKGTKWYSAGQNNFLGDTLTFTSQDNVEYFLGELSWYFDSKYKIEKDTLIIVTVTAAFEVNDITGLKPDLIQKYCLTNDSLKLVYLGNWKGNKWVEASHDRYNNINDFKRIK